MSFLFFISKLILSGSSFKFPLDSEELCSHFAIGLLWCLMFAISHLWLAMSTGPVSEFGGAVYLLHGCCSSWDTIVRLRLTAWLSGLCILDFQVLPQGWPLQAARPKHGEGQPLPTTDAARALTTMTNPNLSPLHPHRHQQITMKKVSLFLLSSSLVFLSSRPIWLLRVSLSGAKGKLAKKMKSCGLNIHV